MLTVTPLHIIFYIFAAIAVSSGIAVITAQNPIRSVLSLVITFFAMAVIWMILQAEFLSLILLLVYVGAVMTLFLFVVMMLNVDREAKYGGFVSYLPWGILILLLMTGLIITAFFPHYFASIIYSPVESSMPIQSNLERIGTLLYTDYVYPFEIAGVILLAAIIAAITLAHRDPRRRKVQDPAKQSLSRREDHVRLVKMPSENQTKRGENDADTK